MTMQYSRSSAASVVVGVGMIISGGLDFEGTALASSEILTETGTVMEGPDLKVPMHGHCMVLLQNDIYVLGGDRTPKSRKTFIHDSNFNYKSDAPRLIEHRVHFVCSVFENKIIVAGDGTSAEIFDPISNSWTLCKCLVGN